jgi:cyclomaltodextrinase
LTISASIRAWATSTTSTRWYPKRTAAACGCAGGDDAIRPEFPACGPAGPSGLAGGDQAIYRLHQRLIGLRRRHPWLHQATSTTLQLRNDQYVIRVEDHTDSLHIALNLADHPLQPPQATQVLAADRETEHSPAQVAPHGWAVLG